MSPSRRRSDCNTPRRPAVGRARQQDEPAYSAARTAGKGVYLRVGGQEKGPCDADRVRAILKAGAVEPAMLGRHDGTEERVPLWELLGSAS